LKYDDTPRDHAIQERLDVMPFDIKFVHPSERKERDKNVRLIDQQFMDDLRSVHLSEVFSYFCKGAHKYYEKRELPECARATAKCQENLDLNATIVAFLKSEYVVVDPLREMNSPSYDLLQRTEPPNYFADGDGLYQQYVTYCQEASTGALGRNMFLRGIELQFSHPENRFIYVTLSDEKFKRRMFFGLRLRRGSLFLEDMVDV
jgi:hypothetical protein